MTHLSDTNQEGFTKADHLILNYPVSNETTFYCETVNGISKKVGVSPATVGGFWPKIGSDNSKESKRVQLSQSSTTSASEVKSTLSPLTGSDRAPSGQMVKNIDMLVNILERTVKLISSEAIEATARPTT